MYGFGRTQGSRGSEFFGALKGSGYFEVSSLVSCLGFRSLGWKNLSAKHQDCI